VTRDAALEVLFRSQEGAGEGEMVWGSGYPSDARCVSWMKTNMHPVFGWGAECRFSWGTAKDMLEAKGKSVPVDWPTDDDGEMNRLTEYFSSTEKDQNENELATWYGTPAGLEAF
jgi:ribonuclease H2 subunit A